MSDPTYVDKDYILAHDIVRHLAQNYAIQFQTDGDRWDSDTMQKHVNTRGALIKVQQILLDEAERLTKPK